MSFKQFINNSQLNETEDDKSIVFGVEYWSGKGTTTGTPNKKTGYMSIAMDAKAFKNKADRDSWVNNGGVKLRVAVSKKQLRNLCLGMSVTEFEEYLDYLISELDIE